MTHVLDSDTYDRHAEAELAAIARTGGPSVVDSPAPSRGIYDGQEGIDRSEVADWGADDVFGGRGRPSGREARRAAGGGAGGGTGRFARRRDRPVDDWLAPVRDARPVTVGRARPAENWLAGAAEHDAAYVRERLLEADHDQPIEDVEERDFDRAEAAADRRAAALDELWSAGEVADSQTAIRIRPPSLLRSPSPRPVAPAAAPPSPAVPAARPLTHEYRDVGGRRTVVVRGRPATESLSPATEIVQRSARALGRGSGGTRPERLAAWAVGLGFLLILVAVATANAAVPGA